jgi:hypothetical protein
MDTITQIINWFGLIYVGLPLFLLIILISYKLFGGQIGNESLAKILEFSKWYMVSVAVVFSAKTIETGFSERETGIKEMQVYDKYVTTILEADNIEARWKLAEYFSTVTPTDRLRERWIAYKELIKDDYQKFKDLDSQENTLLSQQSLTSDQKATLNYVQREKATYEKKLIETRIGRWVIVFTADTGLEQSRFELKNLIKAGIDNSSIHFKDNFYRILSNPFQNKQEAIDFLNAHKEKIRKDAYIVDLDKWCPNEKFNGDYYECN